MLETENLYALIDTISAIDNALLTTREINFEHLKLLMLITFNECLIKEPNPLIKSYLTVTIDHLISIEDGKNLNEIKEENTIQPQTEYKNIDEEKEILSKILHGKVPPIR